MIVLLPNLGAIILGAASILLVQRESKDKISPYIKAVIIVISICLMTIATTNMLYHNSGSEIFVTVEIYSMAIIAVLWFSLIYWVIYAEIRKEARWRERELEALNSVALAVGQSMDLPQILRNALLSVIKIGNFDVGFIYLLNKQKNTLELATSYGNIPKDLAEKLSTLHLGQEV
ncbi:MAG TPA: hypothetical protein VE439_10805 [Anaerolineae bacterium]|jgi:large-conductance mechanosensitive channel|nr:hypothetical protein [Anaerolineae bacterium]